MTRDRTHSPCSGKTGVLTTGPPGKSHHTYILKSSQTVKKKKMLKVARWSPVMHQCDQWVKEKKKKTGNGVSLAIQWLRLYLPVQEGRFDPWSGRAAKISHTSWPKPKNREATLVTNSIKTLKMVHIKKCLKKTLTIFTWGQSSVSW